LNRIAADLGESKLKFRKPRFSEELRNAQYEFWDDSLKKAGFQLNLPTIWVLEGVLMYLGRVQVIGLLRTIRSLSCDQSMICADIITDKKASSLDWSRLFLWDCPMQMAPSYFEEGKWRIKSLENMNAGASCIVTVVAHKSCNAVEIMHEDLVQRQLEEVGYRIISRSRHMSK
jgi:O-methyltransferase involved in polyketide biosynthesis